MPEPAWFEHNKSFEQTFKTAEGWVAIVADIAIHNGEIHLENLLIEPLGTKRIRVGASAMLRIRREVDEKVRQEGYTGLVLEGVRI